MNLIVISLCIYCLSSLLMHYDGAFGIFAKVRKVKQLQSILECQVCTAFWVALPFVIFYPVITVLAAYGLVILLVRYEP